MLGNNLLFFKENDKLINLLATYLSDACPEVRATARSGLMELQSAIMGKNDLERLLQRVLNETQYKKVKDFLDKEQSDYNQSYQPGGSSTQADFLITNAHHALQHQLSLKVSK